MNDLFRIFLLILVSIPGVAQPSFRKTFGGNGYDRGLYITHTADKGYIACGYTMSFGDNYNMYVVKLDEQGTLQWQKNYGGSKMEIGWSITELNNKGYILHGSTASKGSSDDIYLLRLDTKGNVLWEKSYGNGQYERTTNLVQTSDNHYLLIGQRNIDSTNIDSYILKIDTSGNLLWEKTFGGSFVERTFYGAETARGEYLISGLILPYKNNKADILLMKITKEGDLRWSKTIGDENVHEIVHSFSLNKDKKTFTMIGYTESSQEGVHDGLFMQIDDKGNILTLERYHTGEDLRLMHAEETPDGGFIATGFTHKLPGDSLHDAVLLKFNKRGITEWMKTFGMPDTDDQGYWVVTNPDGGYTLTGYTFSFGVKGDLWVIKTNNTGD
jgi:hypothetical protein